MKIQLKRSNVLENGVAKEPTAGQMEYGELAVNYNENDISIFTKDSDNNIRRVGGSVNKGSGQPDDPGTTPGDWYFDITNNILYYWDGSDWEEVQAVSKLIGGDGIEITTATTGTTFAVDLAGGDDGLEFDGGKLKATIASSSEYGVVKIGNGLDGGDDGIIKARNTITVGEDPPVTNLNQGDLWWNSGEDSGRLYVYYEDENTQQWIDASPQGGNLEQDQADQLYLSKKNDDTAVGNITFTKKIFVDEAVGIGTNNPSTTLELSSSDPRITLTDTDAPKRKTQLRNTNGNTYLSNLDSGNIIFGVPTETMRITSSGNVGIGTDAPESLFHLKSADAEVLQIMENSVGTVKLYSNNKSFIVDADQHRFRSESGDEYARILANGNVGIGTASPSQKLEVVSDASTVVRVTSGDSSGSFLDLGKASSPTGGRIGYDPGNNLLFCTETTEKMRIKSNGNVGIGTDTPAEKLTVSDDAARGIRSHCPNIQATDTNKGLRVTNGSDTNTFSVSYKGQGYFAGNLGIGIDTPTNGRLVVNGPPVNGVPAINLENYNSDVATTSDITLTNNAVVSSKFNLNLNSVTGSITFNRNGDNRTGLNGTAESARFDISGRLLVGTSSNQIIGDTSIAGFQLVGVGNASKMGIVNYGTGDSDAATINLGKSKSGTAGTPGTSVGSNSTLGSINFAGDDGTDIGSIGAAIQGRVDGTPGTNDMPGRLSFLTTADGASSPTERMRIDKDGRIGLNGTVNNARFYFGGDTAYSSDVDAIGYQNAATISSNTTGTYQAFNTYNAVSATTDLSKCVGYGANFESIKPGGKLADLIGFRAGSSLTAATNNYGFYSDIAPGTGRWNFYANGTAQNYFAGDVLIGSATAVQPSSTTTSGFTFRGLGAVANMSRADNPVLILQRTGSDGEIQQFYRQNTQVGNISVTDTATAFNTSSDYRLKENITSIVDAADRVKALKPCRFNFKADADKTVDGFLAHEAQEVVPEAVTGTKDATEAIGVLFDWDETVLERGVTEPEELTYTEEVTTPAVEAQEATYDEDGKELTPAVEAADEVTTTVVRTMRWEKFGDRAVMQGIDQSKLVPLLTAALQEALKRIEQLESKVSAL